MKEIGIDPFLKYAVSTRQQQVDNQIVDSLRNFLFGQPGDGGLDLASLNIQRGRDHGLADYNTVREAYGLTRVTSFAEITSDTAVQAKLEQLYGSVDNIDLWVGGLAEDRVSGAAVGATIQAVLTDQFARLRLGDRFWYENSLSASEVTEVNQTKLADVLKRNTTLCNIQNDSFAMTAKLSGKVYVTTNDQTQTELTGRAMQSAKVELLNVDGVVIAQALTDQNGAYNFDQFEVIGQYTVRLAASSWMQSNRSDYQVVLSRGDQIVADLDFGVSVPHSTNLSLS